MSEILDTYDLASRNGWKIAHPWADNDIDIFRKGNVLIVVCWAPDETVETAHAVPTDTDGVLQEFPNQDDTDGLVAVQRWLTEVTP